MEITGIIITKNEENHIAGVVENLLPVCRKVIVVDSGSTDNTVSIAEKSGAEVVFHQWAGYRDQRRFADTLAETDWILVLDADERLSAGLREVVIKLKKQEDPSPVRAYAFRRNLHFMGKCFRNTFLTCEWKTRLYNRNFAEWTGGSVHENLSVNGKIQKISGTIDHYPYQNMEDAAEKLRRYAFLKAADKFKAGKSAGFWKIVLNIKYNFIKKYLFQFRFLKGTPGLILSWLETDYTALKYMRLYELNNLSRDKEKSDDSK
ncbi:MAG: glycosyltransferase family 2 protein [Acidobacteria bacterium]|nr:glycosyltransferase family 2 protein [Acidobacteriota bacterium]